jgi:hypothetical protein
MGVRAWSGTVPEKIAWVFEHKQIIKTDKAHGQECGFWSPDADFHIPIRPFIRTWRKAATDLRYRSRHNQIKEML